MFKKKYEKLSINDKKRLFNIYINTNKSFKFKINLLIFFITIVLLFENKKYFMTSSILFLILVILYLFLSNDNVKKWYDELKQNPLKNKEVFKIFRKKEYFQLTRLEKVIVQQEYRKSEKYNLIQKIFFYFFTINSIILFIRKIITINSFIYNLLLILLFLIYDLLRMKKWYKDKKNKLLFTL